MKNTVNQYENIKDYSNRSTFDGSIPKDDETIQPFVLTKDIQQLLALKGYKNYLIEYHPVKNNDKKIKVAFMVIKKKDYKRYKTFYNYKVTEYLEGAYQESNFEKHLNEEAEGDENDPPKLLSLDKIMEDVNDDGSKGYDPTGTTKYDDAIKYTLVLNDLLDSLDDQLAKKVIQMRVQGYKKTEIHKKLYPNLKKSQAYDEINKVCNEAAEKIKEIYYK